MSGQEIFDRVPRDAPGALEIGFSVPERYNASAILFDNLARGNGNRAAVIGASESVAYAELCQRVSRWARIFAETGLKRGDRVLLFLDDTPVYPAAFFGAMHAGFVPLLTNTLTPPDLLQFYLADSGATVAVSDAAFADRFSEEACRGTLLDTLFVVNGNIPDKIGVSAQAISVGPGGDAGFVDAADTGRDDPAFWMYSSGSTGRPKGIVHLHHDMAYTARAYERNFLKLSPDDICFSVPKIFFAYGLGNSITFPFSVGAASLLLEGQPKPATIFETIRRHRPSVFFGLPTLYTALTKAPEARDADLSSLRLSVSAAEILSAEVFQAWKTLSGLEIMEGLGSTEVLHIYLSNSQERKKPGAAGRRVPGYELALRDSAGRDVDAGEEGILWIRGDSNAPLYWNRPEKTAETMREHGWIYTGDRFIRDSEGFHFFQGRADELVKVSGQWVYPLEVELCLANHPSVRECAVLPVQMADKRTTLKAFVVLTDAETSATTAMLQDFVKQTLLPYKYPRVVEYLSEIPKTGTGKIDRQALIKRETSLSPAKGG